MNIDNRVTGKTKLLGVIGNPIEHSISPQLHNTVSKYLGEDYIYVPFKVGEGDLEEAVKGLKALNYKGFNVTIPFKNDIIRHLDEISEEVEMIGAANTVKISDGKLFGYNTDTYGFSRSFKEESGTDFKGKKVVVLGAGGAARAIAVKTALEGAASIDVINRTVSRAAEITDIIQNKLGVPARFTGSSDPLMNKSIENADIIVNTTSVGMYPKMEECPVDENINLRSGQIVYDIIYNPVKTQLLKKAEGYGCKVINGLGMLFYQGIYAYEIWTGNKLNDKQVKDIYDSFMIILER